MTQIMTRRNIKYNNDKINLECEEFYENKNYECKDFYKNYECNEFYENKNEFQSSRASQYTTNIKKIFQGIDALPPEFCWELLHNHVRKNNKNGVWIPIKNTPFWSGGQSEVYILYKAFLNNNNELNIEWGIAKNFNDKDNFKLENRMFNIIKKKSEENNSNIYKKYIPKKYGSIKTVINGKSKNFLVMEFVDGYTLSKLIKHNNLNNKLIINIMIQLCEVIGFFHEVGISHRDLKPQNIIIVRDSKTVNNRRIYDDDSVQIKIIDFGLSYYSKSKKNCKDSVGTINYCSPEIFLDNKNGYNSYKADLWSLGIIFYTMVCGHSPYITPLYDNDMFLNFMKQENYCNIEIFNIIINGLCDVNPDQRFCLKQIKELLNCNYDNIITKMKF
jgi:serine/threonine protein kinase